MTDSEQTNHRPRAQEASKVAWPSRILSAIIGPPTKARGPTDGRLRYRACEKCAGSVGLVNVIANTFLMLMKAYLGVVGRSTALVADAIHSSADVISSVMLLFGLRMAKKPKDSQYPYGYGKVEFLVAVAIYSSLILAGIVIFADAISCIIHGVTHTPSVVTIMGALISVVVNEMMHRQSICAGTQIKSPSMMANAWEKRSDALSSFAVFLGILGAKVGWNCLDPLTAILVSFYILKTSIEGITEAFRGLMDMSLPEDTIAQINATVKKVEGVLGIGHLRTREVGQVAWVDLEIFVDRNSLVDASNLIKNAVKRAVHRDIGREANVEVYLKPA